MASLAPARFYVYVLSRPNGQPFYVGKGQRRRMYDHSREAQSGHDCYKCRVIRKIWSAGGEITACIVFATDNEAEALTHEIELIALYGRDTLANLTDGGEGMSGNIRPPETRAKIAATMKQQRSTPEYRDKARAATKARYNDPDEHSKTGAVSKAQWANPDTRSRIMAGHQARMIDPEYRARRSAEMHRRYDDPDFRAHVAATNKSIANDPEVRAKKSASMKAMWARRRGLDKPTSDQGNR